MTGISCQALGDRVVEAQHEAPVLVKGDFITMRHEGRYSKIGRTVFEADRRTLEPFSDLCKVDTPTRRILQACFEVLTTPFASS